MARLVAAMTYVIDDDAAFERYRSFWTDLFGVPFSVGYVDAGGIRTRYLSAGDPAAPTVVMLHGIAGSLELFTANVGPLSAHFHVLAFDLVGFGLSDKAAHDLEIADYVTHLTAFLDALGVGEVSLFAVSLGTWVSVAFAARHPERVRRLVLIAPAGLLVPPENMARFSQEQALDTVDNPGWARLNRTFDHLVFAAASKLPDALAVRRRIALDPDMPASTRRTMSLLDPEAMARNRIPEEVWRALATPVLFVECPDTVDLSFHLIRLARTLLPHCEVLSVPRTAHWPHFEAPDEVNPAAIRFLTGGS